MHQIHSQIPESSSFISTSTSPHLFVRASFCLSNGSSNRAESIEAWQGMCRDIKIYLPDADYETERYKVKQLKIESHPRKYDDLNDCRKQTTLLPQFLKNITYHRQSLTITLTSVAINMERREQPHHLKADQVKSNTSNPILHTINDSPLHPRIHRRSHK